MNFEQVSFDTPGVRETWHRLLDASDASTTSFFQTWEWNAAWWRVYGEPDRRKDLWLMRIDDVHGPTAFCPLYRQRRTVGRTPIWTHLLWIGHELSPYPDLVNASAEPGELWRGIIDAACAREGGGWLELHDIGEEHPLMHWRADGIRVFTEEQEPVLHWDIPPSPEAHSGVLERVRPQFRRNIRKAIRAFESHGTLSWRFRSGADAEAMRALTDLNGRRFRRRSFFSSQANRDFYHQLVTLAPDALFFSTLSEADRIIHVLAGFEYRNVLYYFMAGMDESFLAVQPGVMNFYFTLTHAAEHGYRRFDFLRGTERYKYDLGAEPHRRFRVCIVPESSLAIFQTVLRLRHIRRRVHL